MNLFIFLLKHFIYLFIYRLAALLTQGYNSSSKDHKGTFLDDWDLSEANRSEVSEVNSIFQYAFLSMLYLFVKHIFFSRSQIPSFQHLKRCGIPLVIYYCFPPYKTKLVVLMILGSIDNFILVPSSFVASVYALKFLFCIVLHFFEVLTDAIIILWWNIYLHNLTFKIILLLQHQNVDQRHALDQDQSSMLKVICSQRDRFRTRLRETEEVCYYSYNTGLGHSFLIPFYFMLFPSNFIF